LDKVGEKNPERLLQVAVPFLRQADLDVEIRVRLTQVVRLALEDGVYFRPRGYIGMYMVKREVLWDKKILPAIMIDKVVDDGPCANAGLVVGDYVIGVDGKLFNKEITNGEFIGMIQARRPGDKMTLKMLREKRVFEVELALTKCPPNLLQTKPDVPFDVFFDDWWRKHIGRR